MKVATLVALVAAGATPIVATTGVEWLGMGDVERVLHGENVTDVAADIAQREFRTNATLVVLGQSETDTMRDNAGGRVRADEDASYRLVRVRLANDGRLDMPVHTRHFVALDDIGHAYAAEWGVEHGIDVPRLASGASVMATLAFHVPDHVPLVSIAWRGEFAEAAGVISPVPPPAPRDAAPADGSTPAPTEEPAGPPEDEYQSHWDA